MMAAASTQYVGYYQVSTAKQGRSGLGLEAQKAAVAEFVRSQGGTLAREFTEVESGKRNDRPELVRALAHARRTGATLLVAKLDRLSRNLAFLSALMESKVDFRCCDNPHATRFTIHILAAVAEHEREMISRRTKDALRAAKARGVALGSARAGFWADPDRAARLRTAQQSAAKAGARQNRTAASDAYGDLIPDMKAMRGRGMTLDAIATHLNEQGHTTRTGLHPTAAEALRDWERWFAVELERAEKLGRSKCPLRQARVATRLAVLRRCAPRPDGLVFPSFHAVDDAGEPAVLTNVDSGLESALAAAGIPRERIGLHVLRHTFAVNLCRAGVAIYQISRLLGHADTRTTEAHYLRFAKDEAADVVGVLAGL